MPEESSIIELVIDKDVCLSDTIYFPSKFLRDLVENIGKYSKKDFKKIEVFFKFICASKYSFLEVHDAKISKVKVAKKIMVAALGNKDSKAIPNFCEYINNHTTIGSIETDARNVYLIPNFDVVGSICRKNDCVKSTKIKCVEYELAPEYRISYYLQWLAASKNGNFVNASTIKKDENGNFFARQLSALTRSLPLFCKRVNTILDAIDMVQAEPLTSDNICTYKIKVKIHNEQEGETVDENIKDNTEDSTSCSEVKQNIVNISTCNKSKPHKKIDKPWSTSY